MNNKYLHINSIYMEFMNKEIAVYKLWNMYPLTRKYPSMSNISVILGKSFYANKSKMSNTEVHVAIYI